MNSRGYNATQHTQPSRVMFIDSRDATQVEIPLGTASAFNTHFAYNFEQPLHAHSNEVILVSLMSATIPYSFYNIRNTINNQMTFRVTNGSATIVHNISLEPGNYTATSLQTTLAALMTAATEGGSVETTIAIDYDRVQQKFKFSTETPSRTV